MYVFNLLAQREGKAHKTTRSGSVDFGSIALATKEAAKEAEREVGAVILTLTGWATPCLTLPLFFDVWWARPRTLCRLAGQKSKITSPAQRATGIKSRSKPYGPGPVCRRTFFLMLLCLILSTTLRVTKAYAAVAFIPSPKEHNYIDIVRVSLENTILHFRKPSQPDFGGGFATGSAATAVADTAGGTATATLNDCRTGAATMVVALAALVVVAIATVLLTISVFAPVGLLSFSAGRVAFFANGPSVGSMGVYFKHNGISQLDTFELVLR